MRLYIAPFVAAQLVGRTVQRIDRRALEVRTKQRRTGDGLVGIGLDEHLVPGRGAGDRAGGVQAGRILVQVLHLEQLSLAAGRLELAGQAVLARVLRSVRELRDHDRRQDAQDDHDDQNFDERETTLKSAAIHVDLLK